MPRSNKRSFGEPASPLLPPSRPTMQHEAQDTPVKSPVISKKWSASFTSSLGFPRCYVRVQPTELPGKVRVVVLVPRTHFYHALHAIGLTTVSTGKSEASTKVVLPVIGAYEAQMRRLRTIKYMRRALRNHADARTAGEPGVDQRVGTLASAGLLPAFWWGKA